MTRLPFFLTRFSLSFPLAFLFLNGSPFLIESSLVPSGFFVSTRFTLLRQRVHSLLLQTMLESQEGYCCLLRTSLQDHMCFVSCLTWFFLDYRWLVLDGGGVCFHKVFSGRLHSHSVDWKGCLLTHGAFQTTMVFVVE